MLLLQLMDTKEQEDGRKWSRLGDNSRVKRFSRQKLLIIVFCHINSSINKR